MKELEAQDKPQIRVLNKFDLVAEDERAEKLNTEDIIHVSAKNGTGLGSLLEAVDHRLTEDALSRLRVSVPQSEGKVLAMIEAKARVFSRQYRDGSVEMELQAPESVVRRLKNWAVNSLVPLISHHNLKRRINLNGPTIRMQVNVLITAPYDPESDRR